MVIQEMFMKKIWTSGLIIILLILSLFFTGCGKVIGYNLSSWDQNGSTLEINYWIQNWGDYTVDSHTAYFYIYYIDGTSEYYSYTDYTDIEPNYILSFSTSTSVTKTVTDVDLDHINAEYYDEPAN